MLFNFLPHKVRRSFCSSGSGSGSSVAGLESMWTTSRMVGRAVLFSSTHSMATLKRLVIRSGGLGERRRSTTESAAAAVSDEALSVISAVVFRTQRTMSMPSPNPPTGRRPVSSSRSTTPKLYTSLFSSTRRV